MKARTRARSAGVALFVYGAIFGSLSLPGPAQASREHSYEVVMVLPRPEGELERAFEKYFAKVGAVLHVEVLIYSGRPADQPALVAQLRRLAPDLIYTWDTPTTLAVAGPVGGDPVQYIRNIPVVFTSVSDPIAAGLVSNLERPGRNVTGVIPLGPAATQLKAIDAYRHLRTLGFLYDGGHSQTLAVRDQLRLLAHAQRFRLVDAPIPMNAEGELDTTAIAACVATLKAGGADFLYIGPETFVSGPLQEIVVSAAVEQGLPSFSALENAVRRHGALFGLVSPQSNVGRFAAIKALRILQQHVPAADVPIEPLQGFSPLINMQTALTLEDYPPLLLLEAAEVVSTTTTETTPELAPDTDREIDPAAVQARPATIAAKCVKTARGCRRHRASR